MKTDKLKSEWKVAITLVSSLLLVLALVVLLKSTGLDRQVYDFLEWVRASGHIGLSIFFVVVALAVVLLVPTAALTLAAGYLYGIVGGVLVIVIAETIGAYVAFALARRFQEHKVLSSLRKRDVFQRIGDTIVVHGWRIIAVVRMIPFFPFKLSNYFFGLTTVNARHYIIGTLLGLCPITAFNVYLGSMAGDLLSLGSTGFDRTPMQWFLYIVGLILIMFFVLKAGYSANKKFNH